MLGTIVVGVVVVAVVWAVYTYSSNAKAKVAAAEQAAKNALLVAETSAVNTLKKDVQDAANSINSTL